MNLESKMEEKQKFWWLISFKIFPFFIIFGHIGHLIIGFVYIQDTTTSELFFLQSIRALIIFWGIKDYIQKWQTQVTNKCCFTIFTIIQLLGIGVQIYKLATHQYDQPVSKIALLIFHAMQFCCRLRYQIVKKKVVQNYRNPLNAKQMSSQYLRIR